MLQLFLTIFFTGGSILSLQLLASRIMTPYFGVSLYIWAGILSMTLLALALGYYGGGRLSHHDNKPHKNAAYYLFLFLLMPALSALAMAGAALLYPGLFYQLAFHNVMVGAFIACAVFLFVPLLTTSSMNPILVAYITATKKNKHDDDAGSGKVFFISTLGSVAGVLWTAFLLIPHMSNFQSVALNGLVLAAFSLWGVWQYRAVFNDHIPYRKTLWILGLAGLVSCAALFYFTDEILKKGTPIQVGDLEWKVLEEYPSHFGDIKVATLTDHTGKAPTKLFYFHDGFPQNIVDADTKESLSSFSYFYEIGIKAAAPKAKDVLMLGMAAGTTPMILAEKGYQTDIVEINPTAFEVAKDHFGFTAEKFNLYQKDARIFVKQCPKKYDAVAVDLFLGDGVPDYLVTQEFFADLKACLNPGGVVLMNAFASQKFMNDFAHLLKTIHSEFAELRMMHTTPIGENQVMNAFIIAGNHDLPYHISMNQVTVPSSFRGEITNLVSTLQKPSQILLDGAHVMRDDRNDFPKRFAQSYRVFRQNIIRQLPPTILVN